ncbi:pol-like protein [Colletotrichum kahawae]|uniref:Pol-like protein n=1 Tax=Colletotrichum kahawae TaxID=34407 RepID=A0AAD9YAX0_COLKA|nr:pol-like protein [Colletotrichum kahawae]
MDPPEGSVNDAMNAEINRRINEAVNVSVRPLQDQITQLLTALNELISPDRATPTPLASSVPTPSTADTTIQATSDDRRMVAEGRRKPLPDPPKFTGKRKEYAGYDEDIWYYINSCLNRRPQQVVATFYAAGGPGGLYNPQEFLSYLDRTYKDLYTYDQAALTLRTLY